MNKKDVIALVRKMQEQKSVLVPMVAVAMFVATCHDLGQLCFGGSFTDDFKSQYFYI